VGGGLLGGQSAFWGRGEWSTIFAFGHLKMKVRGNGFSSQITVIRRVVAIAHTVARAWLGSLHKTLAGSLVTVLATDARWWG
jgi:hypothetical protein